MSFINVNFDDAVESKPAASGVYNLQIVEAKEVQTGPNSKHPGSPQLRITLGFTDEPNTPNITHFVSLPHEQDEQKSALYKALLLKRFLVHFNIPFDNTGIDTERVCMEAVGASANTEVRLDEPDANGNVYNRLVIPRLRNEGDRR